MRHLDLFSGIGGFAVAAESVWGGSVEHVFCDNDPFCQAVIRKHWPNSKIYGDIRKLRTCAGVDLLTGGFPCQPFSVAGQQKAESDDRFLWPQMLRVIKATKPRWIVAENVAGIIHLALDRVCADLETVGYEVRPVVIPACAVGAPHRRDRVWIIAHATGTGRGEGRTESTRLERQPAVGQSGSNPSIDALSQRIGGAQGRGLERRVLPSSRRDQGADTSCGSDRDAPDAQGTGWKPSGDARRRRHGPADQDFTLDPNDDREQSQGRSETGTPETERKNGSEFVGGYSDWREPRPTVATRLCAVDDGLPGGLVRPRGWRNAALKAAGNAIVPQVAEQIFRAIKAVDSPL